MRMEIFRKVREWFGRNDVSTAEACWKCGGTGLTTSNQLVYGQGVEVVPRDCWVCDGVGSEAPRPCPIQGGQCWIHGRNLDHCVRGGLNDIEGI